MLGFRIDIRDIVNDGINGYLIKIGDIEGTANIIEKIYKDKKLLDDISDNDCERVKKYCLDDVVNHINKILI